MKNKSGLRIKEPEDTARLPFRIATGLYHRLSTMADKHLPRPTKTVFLDFTLNLGLDYYEQNKVLEKEYRYKGNDARPYKLPFYIKEATIVRLVILADRHKPEVKYRSFTEYIIHLGIEHYYKEYTIYGFKKD